MTQDEWRVAKEAAFQAEQMSEHAGWAVIRRHIEQQMARRQKEIITGSCKSLEAYREATGWLAGAQAVLDAPQELEAIANRLKGN